MLCVVESSVMLCELLHCSQGTEALFGLCVCGL